MFSWIKARRSFPWRALWRPRRRIFILLWVALGTWDLLVAQFLPPSLAEKAPRVYDGLAAMSGWLPLWAWAFIGLLVLLGISIEYGVRQKHKAKPEEKQVEPDITVWEAFQRIADPNQSIRFIREIQLFCQKAFDGAIDVWGKESPSGVRKKLPRGYWEFYTINPDSLFRKGSHGATTVLAQTVRSVSDPKMIQLETVWYQVQRHFFGEKADEVGETSISRPLYMSGWGAVLHIYNYLKELEPHRTNNLDRACDFFAKEALEGRLEVSGRKRGSDKYEGIGELFWNIGRIDPLRSMQADGDGGVATSGDKEWIGLRVKTDEVKKLWPGDYPEAFDRALW